MSSRSRLEALGIILGVALFALVGLVLTNADTSPARKDPPPSGINEEVIAPARALGVAFAAVAAHVKSSVVSVSSEKMIRMRSQELPFPFGDDFFRQFFGDGSQRREYRVPQHGMGTGVIIDDKGHVLTNFHVVRDVDEIKVIMPDKRSYAAKMVGADPKTDIAVIRIRDKPPREWIPAQLGDSDALEVGDMVLAVGAPFGLAQTVTMGIISAKGRSNVGIADFEDFLQTDAAINPGNSGGPLVNMRGEVIGLNTAIATNVGQYSGVGFSIPANIIKSVLPVLVKGGTVVRGMLDIVIQDLTPELARQFRLPPAPQGEEPKGALIAQVNPGSPADKAGLRGGDIVLRYQGKVVEDTQQLRNRVAETAPGTKVELVIWRDGKQQTITAYVGQLESAPISRSGGPPGEGEGASRFGFAVEPLTPALAKQLGYQHERGVVISHVEEGSIAAIGGLHAGDLLVEADRQKIGSVSDLESVLNKAKDKEAILLLIKRQGASLYVILRLQ